MQRRISLIWTLVAAGATVAFTQQPQNRNALMSRPEGPCDIYGAAQIPCVAAHSTTRALYASYNGPLYRVKRQSDGKTLDIGVVHASVLEGGGFADAAAQDAFCGETLCVVDLIYDQSGKGNHLYQAAPGTFKGPAKGGFDTQPIADMAPITISGHKAYGIFMMPGMGFRNNDASGIAINDEAEGIYYVIDGTHYDSGCCFDYGNSSTNGRAVGTGTMETTYFGTSTVWGRGSGSGPWIMSDMEAGLFSGRDAKLNSADPTIDSWRFVTAVVDGGGGNRWDLRGGNAQAGSLTTFYSGERPAPNRSGSYWPMRKQGAILLGTGGDNGNGSSGTFYEGVMTTGYPTEATTNAVQANIVAARYDVQRVSLSRITTFTPGSAQDVTVTFMNTTGEPIAELRLSLALPTTQWKAVPTNTSRISTVAKGGNVSVTFSVSSPQATGAGLLTAKAEWTGVATGKRTTDSIASRVRNAPPIKIIEVRFGSASNSSNQFIELYNGSDRAVDISNWSLIHTQSQWAPVTFTSIPLGTKLGSHRFYVLGLASSGLVAPADRGAATIYLRSTTGFSAGQQIEIEGESRNIASVGSPASMPTTVFIPVSTIPWPKFPPGTSTLPVTNIGGFQVGQKIGIDLGGNYELATVTAIGKAATQTSLAEAATAGSTRIKLSSAADITVGDLITVGTGSRKEIIKVSSVGGDGSTVSLTSALRFDHMASVDVSDAGTGISFSPPTKFLHMSGDALQVLGSGVTLDRALTQTHGYGAPIVNSKATAVGYEGPQVPNQWFGGTLSSNAGSIALMDSSGEVVVDAMIYGSQQSNSSANGTIASPGLATLEADQGKGGCIVVTPSLVGGFGASVGRYPDGADADRNCSDFLSQSASSFSIPSVAGSTNIKVASVTGFEAGQTVIAGTGDEQETAVIAMVGSPGGTTIATATAAGAIAIPVASSLGFSPGQTVTIDSGENAETAVISGASRRGVASLTFATPLAHPHSIGAQISGSGITLTAPLKHAHSSGSPIATDTPTPGAPNRYFKSRN